MKKLMVAISAIAAAFGLQAIETGTAFEGTDLQPGTLEAALPSISELVPAQEGEQGYWDGVAGNENVMLKEGTAEIVGRSHLNPAFEEQGWQYVMALETGTSPVTRYINASRNEENLAESLYFDSYVKLTAFDEAPEMGDAKIAVWIQDFSEADPAVAETNLMVSVGGHAQAYKINDGQYFVDQWLRVTIRALKLNENADKIGFVVYTEGRPCTVTGIDFDGVEVTDPIAKHYQNQNQLFPYKGMVSQDVLQSVGFAGKGEVDELVFTRTAPSFVDDPSSITIVAAEHVVGFKIADKGVEWTAGSAPVVLQSDNNWYDVTDIIYENGYTGDATDRIQLTGNEIVIGKNIVATNFRVGENYYGTLADAVAAAVAAGQPLVLNADYEGNLDCVSDISGKLTIDLNGKKFDGEIFPENYNLTIDILNTNEAKDEDGMYLGRVTGTFGGVKAANIYGGYFTNTVENFDSDVGEGLGVIYGGQLSETAMECLEYEPDITRFVCGEGRSAIKVNESDAFYTVVSGIAPETATLRIVQGENVNSLTVTNAAGQEVTSGSIDVSAKSAGVQDMTFADGYELDPDSVLAVGDFVANETYTISVLAKLKQYTVTFTTNNVEYWTITVDHGTQLAAEQIPALTGGAWDADPLNATITAAATFNYTIEETVAPVKPGVDSTPYETEQDANAALDSIQIEAVNEEAAAAGQVEALKKVVVQLPDGKWVVKVAIDEAKVSADTTLATVANRENMAKLVSATGESEVIELGAGQVTPGLYYSIGAMTEIGGAVTEGARALATANGVSIKAVKPANVADKCFFKVLVNMEPTPAN